jgi:hypothetical protein
MTRLTKALLDGGSGLNLMYLDTFEGLGLTRDQLQSSPHPFYRVVPSKQYVPLGRGTLPITFKDVSNYRSEMLTFEAVDFSGPYHVILGWPCYIKFMAIPSYAYLKMLISIPPVLPSPEPSETLLLYVAATTQVISSALVVEQEEPGHVYKVQRSIYYISKILSDCEICYS